MLLDKDCNGLDIPSSKKTIPITNKTTSRLIIIATIAIVAPRTWDPTFPIKILAGLILKYKKAIKAPIKVAQKAANE
jgi:hypothetical protein